MNVLIVMPWRVQRFTSLSVSTRVRWEGGIETDLAVADMRGRLAIRNQNHLFVGGMLARQELCRHL